MTDRPTRASTALALTVTLAVVAALLWQVEFITIPTAAGAVGALCLAAGLWLVDSEGRTTVTRFVASVLTVPVGAGLVGAVTGTALLATAAVFPVDDSALLSLGTLVVVSYAGVAAGCVLAVLGLALGLRNVASPTALSTYSRVSVLAGALLGVVAIVLILSQFVFGQAGEVVLRDAVSTASSPLVAPSPPHLHLSTFALTVALAAGSCRLALAVLPVAELLGDTGLGQTSERRVSRLGRALTAGVAVAGLVFVVAGFADFLLTPAEQAQRLGSGLYGGIQAMTTAVLPRLLLLSIASIALVAGLVATVVRRTARQSDGLSPQAAPLVGGAVVTVGLLTVASPVYQRATVEIADRLPGAFGAEFQLIATELAAEFGEGALLILLATALVGVTLATVVVVLLLQGVGYLSSATTGYSLASAGLFVGTVFAGTLDVPTWLVFGGVVASLTVWDAGEFGTTLGREVGRTGESRTVELVHTGGTVLVGIAGAVVAVGVGSRLAGVGGVQTPETVTALLAVAAGILLLVAALKGTEPGGRNRRP